MDSSVLFFVWWYKEVPQTLKKIVFSTLKHIYYYFSISFLLKTLFAPWKRDVEAVVNPTFQDRIRIFLDNLISRLIGLVVRLVTIMAGIVILSISLFLSLFIIVVWFLLPLLVIIFFISGIYYLI